MDLRIHRLVRGSGIRVGTWILRIRIDTIEPRSRLVGAIQPPHVPNYTDRAVEVHLHLVKGSLEFPNRTIFRLSALTLVLGDVGPAYDAKPCLARAALLWIVPKLRPLCQ